MLIFPEYLLSLFIYFEREGERERRGEAERESQAGSELSDAGLKLMDCEIMTWAEIKSQMLKGLSHPGTRFQGIYNV